MIGAPGSGKSTIAGLLKLHLGAEVMSTDCVRMKFPDCPEDILLRGVRELAVRSALKRLTVFDAQNSTPRARRMTFLPARRYALSRITGIIMNTPLDLCLERAMNRVSDLTSHHRLTPEYIESQFLNLQERPCTTSEGFEHVITLDGRLSPIELYTQLEQHLLQSESAA